MKTPRWNFNKGRHRSVDPVSEAEPLRVQIVKTPTNKRGIRRQLRSCFAYDTVALLEAAYAAAKFGDRSGELVTEDDWIIYLPALISCVLMQIAAADGSCLHLQ
ncbi:MAG: hypothetical protein WB341_02000 [Terracidiphilus sp.]